jgi:hypothetical protein
MTAPRELTIVQPVASPSPGQLEDDGPVYAYPETAILELAHVAQWLRVSERTVERLDIPFALLGKRTKRYLARDVLDYLAKKRVA